MKLLELNHIELDLKFENKDQIFNYISKRLSDMNRVTGENEIKAALLKREKEMSTGIGDGIAIPHTKDSSVLFPTVLYLRLNPSVDYQALDGKLVKDVFLICMPTSYNKEHLIILSKIASALLDEQKSKVLRESKDKAEIFELLQKEIK